MFYTCWCWLTFYDPCDTSLSLWCLGWLVAAALSLKRIFGSVWKGLDATPRIGQGCIFGVGLHKMVWPLAWPPPLPPWWPNPHPGTSTSIMACHMPRWDLIGWMGKKHAMFLFYPWDLHMPDLCFWFCDTGHHFWGFHFSDMLNVWPGESPIAQPTKDPSQFEWYQSWILLNIIKYS